MGKTGNALRNAIVKHPKLLNFYRSYVRLRSIIYRERLIHNERERLIHFTILNKKFKMLLDPYSNHDLGFYRDYKMHRLYEPETSKFIVKTLKKGDTFIDIGANNGYFSLMASILVGSTGKVYAFEPTPDSFKRLQTNVHINKFKNIKLFECALGDKVGKIKLNISKKEDGQNSIADIVDKKESIDVEVRRLDDILKDKKVNLIKIDVEGYEKEVFKGAIKTIKNNSNIKIVFENNPELMILRGLNPSYLLHFFKRLGFEVHKILPEGDMEKMAVNEADVANLQNLCAFINMN